MNRRQFLAAAAGTSLLHALPRCAVADGAESPPRIPAIDTHVHFYDPTRPGGVPWPKPSETLLYAPHLPESFLSGAAGLRVVGTVVVEASPWMEDNQWLLDLAVRHPSIVGVVGNLPLGESSFSDHFRRFAGNPLFRGLRIGLPALAQVGTDRVDANLTRLADANLTLDVLGGVPILEPTLRLARRWRTLRVVVDHVPFLEWDKNLPAMRTALAGLAAQANVYLKISDFVRQVDGRTMEDGAFYEPTIRALLELFGPDRLLYGSNWPVSKRVAPYATVHRVAVSFFAAQPRDFAEKYFWRNSVAAYQWRPRGEAAALILE